MFCSICYLIFEAHFAACFDRTVCAVDNFGDFKGFLAKRKNEFIEANRINKQSRNMDAAQGRPRQ